MKIFRGCGDGNVMVGDRPLSPRFDLWCHSPTGFGWGYSGSGPAQLALAILAEVAGDEVALDLYQRFKQDVIGRLRGDSWEITEDEVWEWIKSAVL